MPEEITNQLSLLITPIQNTIIFGIPLTNILLSLLTLIILVAINKKVNKAIINKIPNDDDTKNFKYQLARSAKSPISLGIKILYGYILLSFLLTSELKESLSFIYDIFRISVIFVISLYLWILTTNTADHYKIKPKDHASAINYQLIPFFGNVTKVFIVIGTILFFAQNLGYSVSGLVASLGIGGIAVAMASRDTISNIFGSVMLLIDRPFIVGDWIKTSDFEGVVEEIGLRSTKIRTFGKTLTNVPNNILANMIIDNQDARSKRRVKIRIGLEYDTSIESIKNIISDIESRLKSDNDVDQEYMLVKFDNFNDSDLSIFIYYFSASTVWEEYLDVRQRVNLSIIEILNKNNASFAFPTRTLHIEQN